MQLFAVLSAIAMIQTSLHDAPVVPAGCRKTEKPDIVQLPKPSRATPDDRASRVLVESFEGGTSATPVHPFLNMLYLSRVSCRCQAGPFLAAASSECLEC